MSPYPSLIPYLLIGLLLIPIWFFGQTGKKSEDLLPRHRNIDCMVGIYALLVLVNTCWQTLFDVIKPYDAASALVIYLLPIAFYWYFRSVGSSGEIRAVLTAISVAGAVGAIFFAYDSYQKLALNNVGDYPRKAYWYSIQRGAEYGIDVFTSRARTGNRSFGLLEFRAVSAVWVVFGAAATLALVSSRSAILRQFVVFAFGVTLVLALNFTAIVCFAIIMFLFEFGGLSLLRGRGSEFLRNAASLVLVAALMVGVAFWIAGDVMFAFMLRTLSYQTSFAVGMEVHGVGGTTLSTFSLVSENLQSYFALISRHPYVIFVGDGFSKFGLAKGGDVGFIETMAKFGVPFFLALLFGFMRLLTGGFQGFVAMDQAQMKREVVPDRLGILQFSISMTIVILIAELHYSVWSAKSVLPILFFVLAMYGRFVREAGARVTSVEH